MKVSLTVVAGPHEGKSFEFSEHDNFLVGRGKQAHFRLPKDDPYFSRLHFLVEVNPPLCRLLDMGSHNGTFVNAAKTTAIDLKDGDEIRGGQTLIRVGIQSDSVPNAAVSTEVVKSKASDSKEQPVSPVVDREATLVPRNWSKPSASGERSGVRPQVKSKSTLPKSATVNRGANAAPLAKPVYVAESRPAVIGDLFDATIEQPKRSSDRPATSLSFLPPDYEDLIAHHRQPFAGYRLVREVGRGGMGIVYQAIREQDQSVVAIKTIRPAVGASNKDVERFLREASVLESLQHPHIVAFRDLGESAGELFFAMDFVPGSDLHRLMSGTNEPLTISRAVTLICQLLEALDYAHQKGIVHRDIKPANLLVTNSNGREHLRVTDFGLARTYQSSRLSGLTTTGSMGGTTPYMAPEQILNFRDVRPPADQYSAVASLYYLLTHRHIYDFPRGLSEQLLMILQSPPIPVQQRRDDIPAALATIIERGLARQPEDRYPDLIELHRKLIPFCT